MRYEEIGFRRAVETENPISVGNGIMSPKLLLYAPAVLLDTSPELILFSSLREEEPDRDMVSTREPAKNEKLVWRTSQVTQIPVKYYRGRVSSINRRPHTFPIEINFELKNPFPCLFLMKNITISCNCCISLTCILHTFCRS